MTSSLRIGSDTLGWQEFGHIAQLGERTKVMPGGDGSLEFTVPGDFAWQHRNVLVPEAEVHLMVDGEPDFGGYLVCEPLRNRLGPQEDLELAAAGPWSMGSRSIRYGYLGIETDYEQWRQYRRASDHAGRFTLHKEGYLELRADTDRTYDANDAARLYYWLHDGLLDDVYIYGATFEYILNLPSANWCAAFVSESDPADTVTNVIARTRDIDTGNYHTGWQGPLTVNSWRAAETAFDGTSGYICPCLGLSLFKDGGIGAPASDPFIRVRKLKLTGHGIGGGGSYAPDMNVSIAVILTDLASDLGATVFRISDLTTVPDEFVGRYPVSITEIITRATLLEATPIEVYFDQQAAGALRFTANVRPPTVDMTRNRLWSVGGRGGESVMDLRPDYETTPEQVEVLFAAKDDASLPDGVVQAARYPASTTSTYPLVESVDLTGEPPMTGASAGRYAQTIYAARQESRYSGEVSLLDTARTTDGQEVPTVKLRPGDRLHVPSLLDCPAAGFYVSHVTYDFRTQTCRATVGEPFDPLGFRPRITSDAGAGRPGLFTSRARRGRGYSRRTGAV